MNITVSLLIKFKHSSQKVPVGNTQGSDTVKKKMTMIGNLQIGSSLATTTSSQPGKFML